MFSQNHFRTTRALLIFLSVMIMLIGLSTLVAMAETEVGVTYNKVIENTGIGFVGKTSHEVKDAEVELNVTGQYADGLVRGKYHLEVVYGYVKVYQDGVFRGYTGKKIGRQSDLGLAAHLPFLTGSGIGIGIVGRNGGKFAKPTLADIAEANDIDPDKIDPVSAALTAEPTGLNIRPGSALSLIIYTDFEWRGIDIGLKGLPQITGDNRAHQFVINTNSKFDVHKGVKLNLGMDIGLQHYQKKIETETAILAALTLSFR